jgi:hypothetical protein
MNIDLNKIELDSKICSYRKSDNCVIMGSKDKFTKGRCCLECLVLVNKEYYSKYQEKYRKRALENNIKKLQKLIIEENNIKVL